MPKEIRKITPEEMARLARKRDERWAEASNLAVIYAHWREYDETIKKLAKVLLLKDGELTPKAHSYMEKYPKTRKYLELAQTIQSIILRKARAYIAEDNEQLAKIDKEIDELEANNEVYKEILELNEQRLSHWKYEGIDPAIRILEYVGKAKGLNDIIYGGHRKLQLVKNGRITEVCIKEYLPKYPQYQQNIREVEFECLGFMVDELGRYTRRAEKQYAKSRKNASDKPTQG